MCISVPLSGGPTLLLNFSLSELTYQAKVSVAQSRHRRYSTRSCPRDAIGMNCIACVVAGNLHSLTRAKTPAAKLADATKVISGNDEKWQY